MRIKNRLIFQLFLLLVISLLSACGGGSGSGDDDGPAITAIEISPVIDELSTNSSTPLEIVATFSDGTENTITNDIIWESDKPAVATVSEAGLVETKNIIDDVTISATYNTIVGSTVLKVTPSAGAAILSIAIPADVDVTGLSAGDEILVSGTYSDGSVAEAMTVTIRSIENTPAGSNIRLTVGDSAFVASTLNAENAVISLISLPANIEPVIDAIVNTTVNEGVAFSYDINAIDGNADDTLAFSLDTSPEGMSIDPTTGVLSWTPSSSQTGSIAVSVTVTDNGIPASSVTQTFSITVIPVDRQAPTVPANVAATVVSDTQVDLNWEISTDVGGGIVAGYKVFVDGIEVAVVPEPTASYSHAGLNPRSSHNYAISAFDDADPVNMSALSVVVTATTTDTQAPTVPIGVSTTAVTETQIDLTWTASTDVGGGTVAGYKVFIDDSADGIIVPGNSYSHTGLSSSNSYNYKVSAFDDATPINESAPSAVFSVSTIDTTAPTQPTGVTATTPTNDNQIDLAWTASTDDSGSIAGYNIYVGDEIIPVDTVTEPIFSHIGLVAGSYIYKVTALDAAGNESEPSDAVSGATNDSSAPNIPTGLQTTVINSNQIDLKWDKSTDVGGGTITNYKVYLNNSETALATLNATQYSHPVVPDTLYTYTVTAVDDKGLESDPSAPVTASTIAFPFVEDFTNGSNGWLTFDDSLGVSDWNVTAGKFVQGDERGALRGNATRASALDGTYHLGTYAYLQGGNWLTDYRLSLDMTPMEELGYDSSDDGHDIGVMFRFKDNDNYYRVSLNREFGYARLERKLSGKFKTLASDARGYPAEGAVISVVVEVKGRMMQVFINDEPRFAFRDPHNRYHDSGTVALYTQDGAQFDNVIIESNSTAPSIVIGYPTAYTGRSTPSFEVSAAVLNMPVNSRVEVDIAGQVCSEPTEAITGSGYFRAMCDAPSEADHTITATLINDAGGVESVDKNLNVGSSADVRLIIGDSISTGIYDTYSLDNHSLDDKIIGEGGYAATLQDLLNATPGVKPQIIFNEAVPGAFSRSLVEDEDENQNQIASILERHPYANIAQVMIGSNDSGSSSISNNIYKQNMQVLIDILKLKGITPVIAMLPPTFNSGSARNTIIEGYNSVIANELSGAQKGPDFYSYFKNRISLFNDDVGDDIHPNGLGTLIMAHLWKHSITNGASLPTRAELPLVLEDICVRINSDLCEATLSYKQDLVQVGRPYMLEENYLVDEIPSILNNGIWIKASNAHSANERGDYLSFNVDRDVDVYIAYDAVVDAPAWMLEFSDTGELVRVSNANTNTQVPRLRVYKKSYEIGVNTDGNIQLGGNLAGGDTGALANYVVIVKER